MKEFFRFAERGATYKTETVAGLTTFLSMAYILAVNPIVLSQAGMDKGAVFTATTLTAILGTLMMGLLANYPIGIASSMGLNSFFTYSVVIGMGIPWQTALAGVFVAGIVFVILSLMKIREKIINVIPEDLKFAIAGGIGFFVAFIGLKNAGIVKANPDTIVSLGSFREGPVLLAVFGFIITVILLIKKVNGGIFYGMVISAIVGMLTGLVQVPHSIIGQIPSLSPTFGVVFTHLSDVFTPQMFAVIFTFLFVGFFDTAGALIAIAGQAGLTKNNQIPNVGPALLSDSLSSVVGSVLGTTTTASFIESSAGIAAGGRTGFASMVMSGLFVLALFFSPVLNVITPEVTAPALIIVGSFMAAQIKSIRWDRLEFSIPAFVTILMMPLTYSVATGIALGFILYPITMLSVRKGKEVHPIMYVLAVIFIGYFIYVV